MYEDEIMDDSWFYELSDDEQVAFMQQLHEDLMCKPEFAQVYNILNGD